VAYCLDKFKLALIQQFGVNQYNILCHREAILPLTDTISSAYVVSAETVNTFKRRLDKFWSAPANLWYAKQISMASETVVL